MDCADLQHRMHFQAINRSAGPFEGLDNGPGKTATSKKQIRFYKDYQGDKQTVNISLGHDNAADVYVAFGPLRQLDRMAVQTPPPSLDLSTSDKEDKYVQVDMPTWTKATVTQAYQTALLNRVKIGNISFHGEWSTSKYKPMFIHDCIMQPGSLAQLLGKVSRKAPASEGNQLIFSMADASGYHPTYDTSFSARLLPACPRRNFTTMCHAIDG